MLTAPFLRFLSLVFLLLQLRISISEPSQQGDISQAYAALAAAHQACGDGPAAAECLQELVRSAKASGNLRAQAEAAENLALIHAKHSEYQQAESQLQEAYELRKALVQSQAGSRAELEKVRILLGLVKGTSRTPSLLSSIVSIDVKALLNWKVQRTELVAPVASVAAVAASASSAPASDAGASTAASATAAPVAETKEQETEGKESEQQAELAPIGATTQ